MPALAPHSDLLHIENQVFLPSDCTLTKVTHYAGYISLLIECALSAKPPSPCPPLAWHTIGVEGRAIWHLHLENGAIDAALDQLTLGIIIGSLSHKIICLTVSG